MHEFDSNEYFYLYESLGFVNKSKNVGYWRNIRGTHDVKGVAARCSTDTLTKWRRFSMLPWTGNIAMR